MDRNLLRKLLKEIDEENIDIPVESGGERILIIDGYNLFYRNFAVLNYVNTKGTHIGGLGGFLRSLGGLVKQLHPTSIYIIFDGINSSSNRKNLIPEYKSGRANTINRLVFNKKEDEEDAKTNQTIRLIHYLKCLPVKIVIIDKVEADDVMSFLSKEISKKPKTKTFLISSDNDLIQLVDENITIYRSVEKEFYTPKLVKEKFKIYPHNFILYKTLVGDSSDKVGGIKSLGPKKFYKLFPELLEEQKCSLEDVYSICEQKYKENIIYSRIIMDFEDLKKAYKVMDLSNPMLDDTEKEYILNQIQEPSFKLDIPTFMKFYNEDGLENVLKNGRIWLQDNWNLIDRYNKSKNI